MFGLVLLSRAQEARFFRISGPVETAISGLSMDGYVTWTNAATNATFTVQVAQGVMGPSNWVDYVQVPAANPATTHRLFDPHPPSGMVLIPAGSFTMGNCMGPADGCPCELPLHTVYVSAFYMDRYEVTKELWDGVYHWATNHGYSFGSAGLGLGANHPVYMMGWDDMVKWCNARSEKEASVPCYYTDAYRTNVYRTGSGIGVLSNACVQWDANGYRLPTEAEWEKAARGGRSGNRFPWGDTISHSEANYRAAGGESYDLSNGAGSHPAYTNTSPVGSFAANGYGLYDMAGNVEECCWDLWDSFWYGRSEASQDDTRGPASGTTWPVVRGGSWISFASLNRCAYRHEFVPPLPTLVFVV